jgi:hypothetical protein
MSCGTKHNQSACPKCGSKMKRVGSWIRLEFYWKMSNRAEGVKTESEKCINSFNIEIFEENIY